MGQLKITSQQIQSYPTAQLILSENPPINRFHFVFREKYWQRKNTDTAIIWYANFTKQSSSKYLVKALNKYALENHRLTQFAFTQLQIMKCKLEGTLDLMFAFQDTYFLYMCMGYVEGYTLEEILQVHTFTQSQTKFVICSLIKIIQNLHQQGYATVSLHPHTIFFDQKQQSLKLIDLPQLNKLGKPVCLRTVGNAYMYSSPQVVQGLPSQIQSDYYCIGLIMFQMMTKKKPVILNSKIKQKQELLSYKIDITKSQIPQGWTPSAIDFLVKLLIKNPQFRLGRFGPTEVRQQSWIQSYDWNNINDKTRTKIFLDNDRIRRSQNKDIVFNKQKQEYNSKIFQSKFKGYQYTKI